MWYVVSVDDPAERVDKADGRNDGKHKKCFPHYRPQLYPHFAHRWVFDYYYMFFYILKK